jgi:hypothetical protein
MGHQRPVADLAHTFTRAILGRHRVGVMRWLRARRDVSRLARADVVFLSYAKAGRTWTRVMLSRLYQLKYGVADSVLLERDNFHAVNRAVPVFLFTMGNYIADYHPIAGADSPYHSKRIIFLARHPADTAVSLYFHRQTRTRQALKDVKRLSDIGGQSIGDYIRSPAGLDHVIAYMNMWMTALPTHERWLLLRYEDLRSVPVPQLQRLATFLEEDFTDEQFGQAVEFAAFERLKEKESSNFFDNKRLQARNPENPDSFKVRRGKVGGYRDYFSSDEIDWIDRRVDQTLDPAFGYRAAA